MPVIEHSETGERELRRLRTLYQLLNTLNRATALPEVYDAAITSLLASTSADRAAILLFEEDGVVRFKAWRGLSDEYRQGVTGHIPWAKGTVEPPPLTIPDVRLDQDFRELHGVFAREGISALAFIPLLFETRVIGKFVLYYAEPHEFTSDELEIGQVIAAHVALATERKRVELACAVSEQRLKAILDNSATLIFIKDLEGRYLLVNRRYEEAMHVSQAELLGRTAHDAFPLKIADQFRKNDERVIAEGKSISVEECVPLDDGIHSYISVKFPLEGPGGRITGICGIATDITDRKGLETANSHLAAIVEGSDDAIISKDLNGLITSWNRAAERLFGYTAGEAVGNPVSMLAPPDRLDDMPNILGRIRQGERVDHYETRRRRKDGETIDVSLTVSPVFNAAGQIIGASKIARDITDRKRHEEERALLLARAQEARQTAELLIGVGPRLATQLDLQKLVQEVTTIATELVGADFGAFFHNVINERGESYLLYALSGAPREAFEKFPMPRNTAVFAPTFNGQGIVRCDDITKDPRYGLSSPFHGMPKGHLPVRSYLAAPVVSRSGEVLGGLFFGHSAPGKFTETHEAILLGIASQAAIAMDNARLFEQSQWAQAELKRSNQELRRANQDLETFAYSASHDLHEPLRTIGISAQLIERSWGKRLEGEDASFLKSILSATDRMNALIQDLLAYMNVTRYAEGPPPSVDSSAVLTTVLESLKGPIDEAGATVTHDRLPAVSIHESRLAQLLQNLVSNAIKYRGKEAARIHISADERDGWCVFSVVDNGIGIEAQFADQIFGLFKRLHSRDRYPGSGIGLSICQRIVEQYGGRIWLDRSVLGGGSTFCFSIPARAR